MADQPAPINRTSAQLGGSSFDLYSEITRQITDMLEQGTVPWRSPILGRGKAGYPKNLNTGKPYRGVNVFLLAFTAFAKGYPSSFWLSYDQAKGRGGNVKKGEKSSMVVFWKPIEVIDPKTKQPVKKFALRYYNVFNAAAQCEGFEVPDAVPYTPLDFKPVEAAEALVKGYEGGPQIEHGGAQAFYRPSEDLVKLPPPERFASSEEYYSTLFHEQSHSTGAKNRLDRKLDANLAPFGSPDYSREELVAEMSAAFLSAEAGIAPAVIKNQAAYINGWLGRLKSDKRLVINAAGAATRSADWIKGIRPGFNGEQAADAGPTSEPPPDVSSPTNDGPSADAEPSAPAEGSTDPQIVA